MDFQQPKYRYGVVIPLTLQFSSPMFRRVLISDRFHLAFLSKIDPGASAPYKGAENFIVLQN